MDFRVFDDADYDESIKSKIKNFARASYIEEILDPLMDPLLRIIRHLITYFKSKHFELC